MSNQSEIAAGYIQALEQSNISAAISYATFALLLYDYLLNFSREVDLIWHQKFTLLSLLHSLNYYPTILFWLLTTTLNSYTPHCTAILQFSSYIQLLSILANTAFQIIRTYAICGQSWIVAISLTLLNLPVFTLNIFGAVINTCTNNFASPSYEKYNTIATITGLLFIISVVILTVLKTFQSAREHKKLNMVQNDNLAGIILSNGALYFILILSINILQITFYFYTSNSLQDIATSLSNFLATILISRFILDLREKAVNPNGSADVQLPHISSLRMAVNKLHSVIAEEFGDPLFHTSYELRQAREAEDIDLEDMEAPDATVTVTPPIHIEEFPWAAGELRGIEAERESAGSNAA